LIVFDKDLKAVDGHRNKVRRIVDTLWSKSQRIEFLRQQPDAGRLHGHQGGPFNGDLLERCEQRVAGMLREAAPRASRRVDYVSLAHILFMSFNGFVAGAYLGVRGDKAVPATEAMTDLIVATTRRQDLSSLSSAPAQISSIKM
jgi:hypothetical protein